MGNFGERRQEFVDAPGANWDPALPDPPGDFPTSASLSFRPDERDYLRDRIVLGYPDSFLAFLVQHEAWQPVSFAWQHGEADVAPDVNRHQLHHARCFSELAHSAQLLYNLLLAEASTNLERIEHYRERFVFWRALVRPRWETLEAWALRETAQFWHLVERARIAPQTRAFVAAFLGRLTAAGPSAIADDDEARDLIVRREVFLKRKLARLVNPTSLSLWGGAAGGSQLDLRWGITQRLLLDVLAPTVATGA